MKPRLPLYTKVLFLAFLNLCLLGLAIIVIVRAQFRFDPGSFLLAPAQSRIMNVAHALALELEGAPPENWDQTVSRYSQAHGVTFVLFDESGQRVAGPDLALPRQVFDRLPRRQRPPRSAVNPGRRARNDRKEPNEGRWPNDRRETSDQRPPRERTPGDERTPDDGTPPDRRNPGAGAARIDAPAATRGEDDAKADAAKTGQKNPVTGVAAPLFLTVTNDPTRYWAGVRIPLRTGLQENPHPGTLVLMSPSLLANRLFFDVTPWVTIGLAVILISVACWLPFIRGMTRSIAQMTRTAGRIAEGQFEIHVADQRRDEIGQLGEAVNRMASRLSAFVNGQKTFLSGIAHELCNPIATIQFGLGNLERRISEDQRDTVADIQEEVQHMSALVNELLSFSRAGMQALDVKLANINVAATVARVLERESSPNVPVEVSVDEKLNVLADAEYLFRALSNVVRNAIRYAGDAGPIQISARADQDAVAILVADSGPGVPEEHVEDLFAPFYRLDAARSQETGGLGLGLAIVRSSVEACQGSVRCRNRQPHGLEVEIRLPAAKL